MNQYQIIIIGAGLSGAVLAERYATLGKKVLVLEKREHIGGNCFDYLNADGILVSKYGAHLFHTYFRAVGLNPTRNFNHEGRPIAVADPQAAAINEVLV